MWTKPQVATFQRCLAAARKWKPALDKLAEIAVHAPQFADRIRDLQTRAENCELLAQTALSVDSTGS